MKTRLAAFALLACCAVPLRAAVEFSGYVKNGAETAFLMSDPAREKDSGWLAVGGVFEEHTVIGFDPQREVLSVEHAGIVKQLPLRRPQMNQATASPEIPLPEVTDAQRRREAVEREVRTRREQRERALEQKQAITDEIRRLGDGRRGDFSGGAGSTVSVALSGTDVALQPFFYEPSRGTGRSPGATDINNLVRSAGQPVTPPVPRGDPRPVFYTESGGLVDFDKLRREQEAREAATQRPAAPPASNVIAPVASGHDPVPQPTPRASGPPSPRIPNGQSQTRREQILEEIQRLQDELTRNVTTGQDPRVIQVPAQSNEAKRKKAQ